VTRLAGFVALLAFLYGGPGSPLPAAMADDLILDTEPAPGTLTASDDCPDGAPADLTDGVDEDDLELLPSDELARTTLVLPHFLAPPQLPPACFADPPFHPPGRA
jgi:hypothetical protein